MPEQEVIMMSVRVPAAFRKRLRVLAARKGWPMAVMVEEMLRMALPIDYRLEERIRERMGQRT